MKKMFRKLIATAVMFLVSAMLLGTSTFAWFSMNNKVTVTGMAVTTKISDNLFIAASTEGVDKVTDANFTSGLHQEVVGVLQPVSTVNGLDFFHTSDAKADGSKATSSAYAAVSSAVIRLNTTDYDAYVDYVFELKAINSESTDKYIYLNTVNLLYNGAATYVTHAFRVAIFVQNQATEATLATTAVAGAYAARGSATAILAPTGFAYFNNTAVSAVNAKSAVSPTVNNAGWTSIAIPAESTKYFKVTVRMWLEGEDTDCYNSKFVTLTGRWTLDLALTLAGSGTAASLISSTSNATNTLVTDTFTAALTNQEIALNYQWYKTSDGSAIADATDAEYTATANDSYYCMIETTDGNRYMTPIVKYPA